MHIKTYLDKVLLLIFALGGIFSACSESADKSETEKDSVSIALPSKIAEVKMMKLEPKVFSHEIVSNGKMSAHDFADLRFLSSDAVIEKIYVKNGDHVHKGQIIASLNRFKIENTLKQNNNDLDKARLELADVLIGQGYDPEKPELVPAETMKLARLRSGMDQAETVLAAITRDLEATTLTAPFDGVVANLLQKVHNRPDGAEPFCRIVSAFASGDTHTGSVTEINPVVNKDGLVKVRASISNPSAFLTV